MPGAFVPCVTMSSTSPDGHALPIVKVLLKWLNATGDDVEFDPVAATRGAALNIQSRMRVLAAERAAAWFASLEWFDGAVAEGAVLLPVRGTVGLTGRRRHVESDRPR